MPSSNDVKIERIKLWQAIIALLTAAVGLWLAVLAFVPSEGQGSGETDRVKENQSSPQSSSGVHNDRSLPKPPEKPGTKRTDTPTPRATPTYDTVKLYVPSQLKPTSIMVDGEEAIILKNLPTVLIIRFPHEERNRMITIAGKEHKCSISQYFSSGETIGVSLTDCQ